jgi:hypothetical protein
MNGKRQVSKKLILAAAVGLVALVPMSAMAAAGKLIIADPTGSTSQHVVTDGGWAGIGLGGAAATPVLPASAVHIIGTSVSGDNNPVSSQIRLNDIGNAGVTGGSGFLGLHNQPGNALPLSGDRLGYFLFGTMSNTLGRPIGGAGLASRAIGTWSDSPAVAVPAAISFETADVSGGRTPRIVIAPNGNVAIGGGYSSLTSLAWYLAQQKLEVIGGVKLNNLNPDATQSNPVKPACNGTDGPTTRGTFWFTNGGASADKMEVCVFDGTNYSWKTITLQ